MFTTAYPKIFTRPVSFKYLTLSGMILISQFLINPLHADADGEKADKTRKYPPRVYNISKIEGNSPQIDGILDEPCWSMGKWDGGYRQHTPDEGAEPSEETEIKLIYDDDAIYVAIRAFVDDVANRDKQIGRRDNWAGDMVGVAFDSYFDKQTAFEFNVSGGGSKVDLFIHPEGFDMSWNAIWDVAVGEEDNAWVAEYRIPFSQLRFPKDVDNRVWGLHSWRWHRKSNMESNWQIIPKDNSGFAYQFGELKGLENLTPKRQIELMPYLSSNITRSPKEAGNPFKEGSEFEFDGGIDAKIGITSNLILDLTVNPDFGQVEADPSELNLSTVETFRREQRPFFLEGKNLFEYDVKGDLLFYSRRIGKRPSRSADTDGYADEPDGTRILGAAKLSGKTENGLSVGGLVAMASKEEADIFENGNYRQETVEPQTSYFVTRMKQEFNDGGSSVGGILTGTVRELDNYTETLTDQAVTAGFDMSHRWWNRTHYVNAAWMGSHVSGSEEAILELQENNYHNYDRVDAEHLKVDPTLTSLIGWGGNIEMGKDNGGHWRYETELDYRSPGLELNDIGFIDFTDRILQETTVRYVENEPGDHLKSYQFRFDQRNHFISDGTRVRNELNLRGNVQTNSNWNIGGRIGWDSESLDVRRLRGGPALKKPGFYSANMNISSDGSKDFMYWGSIYTDRVYDGEGSFVGFWPGFRLKKGSRFTFNFNIGVMESNFDLQWIGSQENDRTNDTAYFVGRLERDTFESTIRFDYNFTPDMSLTYYGNLYLTAGTYGEYKLITNSQASQREDRYYLFANDEWDRTEDDLYFHTNGSNYQVEDPDFNYRSFRSNLVFRWEYKPGSTLYVVWSHGRENSELDRHTNIRNDFENLVDADTNNTFLVKASYWFSI